MSEAVGRVVSESGGIDLLINNAGSGISGAVEFTEGIEVEFSVKTLFVGMDTVTRCCLPHIRKARGRIVCISSAAAVLPVPFQTYYSAMKAAVNAYTMSLANEVRRFGVSVCAVMPGDTSTGFTASRSKETKGDDIYGGTAFRPKRWRGSSSDVRRSAMSSRFMRWDFNISCFVCLQSFSRAA